MNTGMTFGTCTKNCQTKCFSRIKSVYVLLKILTYKFILFTPYTFLSNFSLVLTGLNLLRIEFF